MIVVNLTNFAVSTTDSDVPYVATYNNVLFGSKADTLYSFDVDDNIWTLTTGDLSLDEGRLSNIFQVVTAHAGTTGIEVTLNYHTETGDIAHGPLPAILSDRRFKASRKLLADSISVTIQGNNISELGSVVLYTNPHPRRR